MHRGPGLPAMLDCRPRFLEASSGRLFCVEYPASPALDASAGVLIVAPIGEEMNKCRRMMALAARAFQAAGLATLYVDCRGTGDSTGDFRDATVEGWRDDLRCGVTELESIGSRVIHVLAIRSGALLLDADVLQGANPGRLALWQPLSTGRQVVTQWARLAAIGDVTARGDRGGEQRLRELLATQGYCEIAGYDLSRELVTGLESLELRNVLELPWQHVAWFELVGEQGAALSPAASRVIARVRPGSLIQSQTVVGDPFWATPEIATSAALVAATCDFLVHP
jgi:exosortase A-associated hydrolase 2